MDKMLEWILEMCKKEHIITPGDIEQFMREQTAEGMTEKEHQEADHTEIERMHFDKVLGILEEIADLNPKDGLVVGVPQRVIREAVKMLKEKEPVKPYVTGNRTTFESAACWWYACGACHEPIDLSDKYCRRCGRKVKWDAAD